MRRLVIPGTTVETSRFIFGTSSLMRAGMRRTRRRLLDAAVDNGFGHFDTAPYYGFGVAERDLAPVLKANPGIKVTTKVGIYSPGGEDQSAAAVMMRKVGARIFPALARPTSSFRLDQATLCLEASLRRLGRDHIDIYMLHEPELHQLDAREWFEWLESLRGSGRIGHYGVALRARRLQPFLASASPLADLTQVLESLAGQEADVLRRYGRPLQITYGYISSARARGDDTPVAQLLRLAVKRNAHGPIIVSTRRLERVGQYARIPEAGGA